jgi:16S rRNA G966 N2-methylase RsmD
MKNLSDIPPSIATEAAGFFPPRRVDFKEAIEIAREVFTPREQEAIFQECTRLGITETRALAFIGDAGFAAQIGLIAALNHSSKSTPISEQRKALARLFKALDELETLPGTASQLESAYEEIIENNGKANRGNLYAVFKDDTWPPIEITFEELLQEVKKTVELANSNATSKKGGAPRKTHRREYLKMLIESWETITESKATISENTGFLYCAEKCWNATARLLSDISEGQLSSTHDFNALQLGNQGLRNDLRAILKEPIE